MKTRAKIVGIITLLFIIFSVFAVYGRGGHGGGAFGDMITEPQLVSPLSVQVDLTGKNTLQFRWIRSFYGTQKTYYEFTLYKGYNRVESTVILQQTLPSSQYYLDVDSSMFENNQVYTWAVRTHVLGVGRSDRAYHPFKVIKN